MAQIKQTSSAKKGGLFVGKSHAEGGIPAIVTDTGQPIEVEGGEAIINKKATALHWEELSKINQSAGGGVPIPPPDDADKVLEKFEQGGKITVKEKKLVFDKWRKLVNMTYTELSRYYHSKDGQTSGLTESEAKSQGISFGRESAEWILKMKKTNWRKWSDDMWKWANKQISFISRMSGMQGNLTDEKGKKTPKYKALLIWGNDPKKKNAHKFAIGGSTSTAEAIKGLKAMLKFSDDDEKAEILAQIEALENSDSKSNQEYIDYLVDFAMVDGVELYRLSTFFAKNEIPTLGLLPEEIRLNPEYRRLKSDWEKANKKPHPKFNYPKNRDRVQEFKDRKIAKSIIDKKIQEIIDSESQTEKFKNGNIIKSLKEKQLEIINLTNPAPNEYNTWIRKVEDIKTADEVFSIAFKEGAMYPDFQTEAMIEALESGYITIFSSYPIKQGVFVTPSKMNALEYAGRKAEKIFSKKVQLKDIAWIDESEGQYAPTEYFDDGGTVEKPKLSKKSLEVIDNNYNEVFGFYDFDWNKESERENYSEWLENFYNQQFTKNLDTAISKIKSDIELFKKRKIAKLKLEAFEELIIPALGNEVLMPKLSVYEKLVLMNPSATIESIEKGFIEAKNIIDEDGSINQLKITQSNIFEDDYINLPNFERFVKENPEYKGVFNDWKKLFDEEIELSLKDTYAFRYPSLEQLEKLYLELLSLQNEEESQIQFKDGGKLLKRADGSYSQRGLWDNIRANAGSGKEPTKDMLEQEAKIKQKFHLGGDMSKHLAPNGQPSNLTHEQWHLVRTPEFKAWFGDWENSPESASKVVDENGEPLVVYHGTNAEFTIFNDGAYFTDDYMNADGYAGGENVLEVFIKIKNPFIFNANRRKWDNLNSKYGSSTQEIVSNLDENKYDGVIFNNINDNWFDDSGFPQNVYYTINSKQIKLADGTNTTFDKYNPDIRFELGGIFHGSPYHFDRFLTSKMGSGIGQQDDGWGLYLTTDKESAKNYGKYIYETTLFKGKKPNEYNFLELKKPVPKDLVKKIVEAVYKYYNKEFDINKFNSYYDYVKNESLPKVDFNDFELIRFDYGGYLFYKTLSRTLGGDKKASLFLLDNGIDGLKSSLVEYGVNYRTDYVIFDENAITIEKTEYLPNNYYEDGGAVKLTSPDIYENKLLQIRVIGSENNYYKRVNQEWNFLTPDEVERLKDGAKHELEHTATIEAIKRQDIPNEIVATFIAYDHINEDPNYYQKLDKAIPEKMENGSKIEEKKETKMEENQPAEIVGTVSKWNEVPARWRNVKATRPITFNLNPYDKNLNTIVKNFLSKDNLRPIFSNIYFDKNGLVCTDAHKLLHIHYKHSDFSGIYATPTSLKAYGYNKDVTVEEATKEIKDQKYANWEAVIPKESTFVYEVDTMKLYQYLQVAINYANPASNAVIFKFDKNKQIGFNGKFTIQCLEAMMKMQNCPKLYLHLTEASRSMLISYEKSITPTGNTYCLSMPILVPKLDEVKELKGMQLYGAFDIDNNKYLTCYFDFEDNQIHNGDGSVADYKESYGDANAMPLALITMMDRAIKIAKPKLPILENICVDGNGIRVYNFDSFIEIANDWGLENGLYYVKNNALVKNTFGSVDDYPRLNNRVSTANPKFTMDSDVFKFYLEKASQNAGNDDLRPVMKSIFFQYDRMPSLDIVATDGITLFRGSLTKYASNLPDEKFDFMMGEVKQLMNFVKNIDSKEISISVEDKRYRIDAGRLHFEAKLEDGKYPNWQAVVPNSYNKELIFDVKDLYVCMNNEASKMFAKETQLKADEINIFNQNNKVFISNQPNELKNIKQISTEICDLKIENKTFDESKTFSSSENFILLMPNSSTNGNYFNFKMSALNKVISTIGKEKVIVPYSDLNRAYIFTSDNLNYKTSDVYKPEKVKSTPAVQTPAKSKIIDTVGKIAPKPISVPKKETPKFTPEVIKIMPKHQLSVLRANDFSEMETAINVLNMAVARVPKLYGQDGIKDKVIYLHYFYGNQDWYVAELDKSTGECYGYADFGYGAELGYMSIPEFVNNGKVELDFYFEPKTWSKINKDKDSAFEKQNKAVKTPAKATEKIMGTEYTVGTKAHATAVAKKKQFDDLQKSESGVKDDTQEIQQAIKGLEAFLKTSNMSSTNKARKEVEQAIKGLKALLK